MLPRSKGGNMLERLLNLFTPIKVRYEDGKTVACESLDRAVARAKMHVIYTPNGIAEVIENGKVVRAFHSLRENRPR
jgi:hypothetical protein